jgi:hypothetical protein
MLTLYNILDLLQTKLYSNSHQQIRGGIHVLVKSLTWCSMTVVAILAAAFVSATPVSASNEKVLDPTLVVIAGGCVEPGVPEGTFDVTLTNPNKHDKTYTITVDGVQKTLTVPAEGVNDIAFTELAAGDYVVDVAGPYGTSASAAASIAECHTDELPIVSVDACGCVAPGDHDGRLTLTITNPNDYAVTYTVRVGWHVQDVFVDTRATETVTFSHLAAGNYNIHIAGDDCTELCVHAVIEQCPEEEPVENPGQGAGNPPVAQPVAPVVPQAAPVAVQTTLPAELPDTSASVATPIATVATIQPAGKNFSSLILVAIGVPMVAFAIVRRRQLNS